MDYMFVYADGWWLKIDNIDKLIDYHKKTDCEKYEVALTMYIKEGNPDQILDRLNVKERIERMQDRNFSYLQAATIIARRYDGSIYDGFRFLIMEAAQIEFNAIKEYGAVYINKMGGHTFNLDYTQFYPKKELIFPDFNEKDIRIRKYPYGNHFYAYIGDMQVRNKQNSKWNTYDAAKAAALKVISNS